MLGHSTSSPGLFPKNMGEALGTRLLGHYLLGHCDTQPKFGIPPEHQEWLNAASVHAPWSSSPRLYGQCLNVAWTSLQHVWITNQKSKNPDRNILMTAFKYSGIKSLNMLVLKTEGKKDSDSNLIHEKEENIRKLECFWLTSDCDPENLYRQMLSVKCDMLYQCK